MATASKPPPDADAPATKAAQSCAPEPSGPKDAGVLPAPAPAPKPAAAAPKPAPAAVKPPAGEPTDATAETREPLEAPLAMLCTPKDAAALPEPIGEKRFAGELEDNFEKVLASVDLYEPVRLPAATRLALRVAEPFLGALTNRTKANIEQAVGNRAAFSRVRSTVLNVVLNGLIYPVVVAAVAVALAGGALSSTVSAVLAFLAVAFALAEAVWRMRDRIFGLAPEAKAAWRAACYGFVVAPLGQSVLRSGTLHGSVRQVPFEGYTVDLYDEKTERERRYGTVYTVSEHSDVYLVRLEMPRTIPASSLKRLWKLPDEMPDYDYNISLAGRVLTIRASLRGETLRRLASVSPSFPADFITRIDFDKPVSAFRHRLRDKVLEVIVLKTEAGELEAAA